MCMRVCKYLFLLFTENPVASVFHLRVLCVFVCLADEFDILYVCTCLSVHVHVCEYVCVNVCVRVGNVCEQVRVYVGGWVFVRFTQTQCLQ